MSNLSYTEDDLVNRIKRISFRKMQDIYRNTPIVYSGGINKLVNYGDGKKDLLLSPADVLMFKSYGWTPEEYVKARSSRGNR